MKRVFYWLTVFSVMLAACGSKPAITAVAPLPTLSTVDRQMRVLEALYTAVHDQYIYSDFAGVDWEALHQQYQDKIKAGLSNADFEKAMAEMVAGFPNGSVLYETRDKRIDQEMQNTSLYSGIGAYISIRNTPQPHVVIMSVVKNSPAEQAGLRAHDSIYSIDGQAVTEAEGLDVVQRVRGEAGTTVTLEVASPGAFRHTVQVTRAKLNAADTLQAFALSAQNLAYIRVPVTPEANMAQDLAQVMQAIEQQGGIKGLVLDLRVARSSGDWPLSQLLTLYDNGNLGEVYTRANKTPLAVTGVNLGGSQNLPMVVLVGPDTEGQAEIFAAALQASGRAKIVGLPTAGKIFGYSALPLPDGSRLTLAISSYKTAAGTDLGNTGVQPDVKLDIDWDQVDDSNDPVLDQAAQMLSSNPSGT